MKRVLKAGKFLPAFFVVVMTSGGFGILNMCNKKHIKRNPQKNWKRGKFGIIVLVRLTKYEEQKK